MVLQLVLRR